MSTLLLVNCLLWLEVYIVGLLSSSGTAQLNGPPPGFTAPRFQSPGHTHPALAFRNSSQLANSFTPPKTKPKSIYKKRISKTKELSAKEDSQKRDLGSLNLDGNAGNGSRKKKRGVEVVVQDEEDGVEVGEQELQPLDLN